MPRSAPINGIIYVVDNFFGKNFYFKNQSTADFAYHIYLTNDDLKEFIEELDDNNIQYKTDEDFEEDKSGEELNYGNKKINESIKKIVNAQDLLNYASTLERYKNKIYLTVKGRNKFQLELTDKDLIDKDKSVKTLFHESAFQEQQPSIQETNSEIPKDSELVLSNQYGEIYKSINKGKEYFYAVDKKNNVKELTDKSSALTYLKKQGNKN